jgi:hypothetical protein
MLSKEEIPEDMKIYEMQKEIYEEIYPHIFEELLLERNFQKWSFE